MLAGEPLEGHSTLTPLRTVNRMCSTKLPHKDLSPTPTAGDHVRGRTLLWGLETKVKPPLSHMLTHHRLLPAPIISSNEPLFPHQESDPLQLTQSGGRETVLTLEFSTVLSTEGEGGGIPPAQEFLQKLRRGS